MLVAAMVGHVSAGASMLAVLTPVAMIVDTWNRGTDPNSSNALGVAYLAVVALPVAIIAGGILAARTAREKAPHRRLMRVLGYAWAGALFGLVTAAVLATGITWTIPTMPRQTLRECSSLLALLPALGAVAGIDRSKPRTPAMRASDA